MRIPFRAFGAAGALIAALFPVAAATAQSAPRPQRVGREIVNWDFSPDGAFRRIADRVRATRRPALARGDVRLLNSPSAAAEVTGNFHLPVVLVEFADTVASGLITDTSLFWDVMFNPTPEPGRPYSVKRYYEEVSNGNITITGAVVGWVRTDRTEAFVGQGCNAIGVLSNCATNPALRLGVFLKAALDSLNGEVDWSLFDADGNGVVDFVTFVHPSMGGECGESTNDIWAHRFNLQSLTGAPFTTTTPRPGFPGQFMRVNDYTVQGGFDCTPGQSMKVGTIAHETGHAFGIPDLYDLTPLINDVGEGIGEWGLMGSGNYTRPHSPSGYDAWSLVDLGWIDVDTLAGSRSVTLNPMQTSDTVLIAAIAGTDEYFLLENRARLQSDTAQMDPSRPTFGTGGQRKNPGLLIWHIDQSIVDGARGANRVNSGAIDGVRLVQADGQGHLQAGTNRGDIGDSYPGSTNNRRWTYNSNPAARNNAGGVAGMVIDSIVQVSDVGAVTFRFRRSAPWRATTSAFAAGAAVTVNGITGTSFEEIFGIGDSISLSVADTQFVNSGRTRLVFASWSDGGARAHVIVSDGTPDTVTATLTASHRVNFVANGTGTVGTSGPATNTFVAAGSPVTLTATPTGGATFTNWTGDTTTVNATLVLPMGRPYSVTANFSGAVAVSYAQATNDILGIAAMTTEQRNYLDDVGNNNGTYDLGDYLAFLKANGFVVAPGLLKRIESGRGLAPRMEQ